MSATPPEANTEYSRGLRVSRRPGSAARGSFSSVSTVLAGAGLLGALLLVVAEFTTLYSVEVASRYVVAIKTVSTGSHNAYAMVPIAVLAAVLAVVGARTGSRPALVALVALGVVAVVIAVAGDLPDAHAHGLTARNQLASNAAGPGFYLETLGGILLILAGGLGLVSPPGRTAPPEPRERPRTGPSASLF